ncbi:phospho-sugar mutase [Alloiococcus sp. CFN-8]|uniref:phospho-sugar mutase n=1 Tax=Alloiococcus sp. CFN-8 TaxID=3416081 RepID=UPI003CFAAF5C
MDYKERYKQWLDSPAIREEEREALMAMEEEERREAFFQELSFGTGGLRGVMGLGSGRINRYTVMRAAEGLARYLLKNMKEIKSSGIAIAFDSRKYSKEFALEAALVLCSNGIKTYLFRSCRPTPELSFTVRYLGCTAGIVITASHNPSIYNGIKVYGSDGGQITLTMAEDIMEEISKVEVLEERKTITEREAVEEEVLYYIGEEMDKRYINRIEKLSILKKGEARDIRIIYTPLHGTGLIPVTSILVKLGYYRIFLVNSQILPDGNFPTVKAPNPEEKAAFEEAIKVAEKEEGDIILATDPDCDRVGVAVRNSEGEYILLTGNQIGALLCKYLLSSENNIDEKTAIIKTIVTSDLGERIAEKYGASVFNTLTGFKFIGEKIKEFEEKGDYKFLFGYEESFGYLSGTFVRDKDAVIASMLIVDMAQSYKNQGLNLLEAMEEIYKEYGYYIDFLDTYILKGFEGVMKINNIMEELRRVDSILRNFGDLKVLEDYKNQKRYFVESYEEEEIKLPISDVIKLHFRDGSWLAVRPSGTEPKLKLYYSVKGSTREEGQQRLEALRGKLKFIINI